MHKENHFTVQYVSIITIRILERIIYREMVCSIDLLNVKQLDEFL